MNKETEWKVVGLIRETIIEKIRKFKDNNTCHFILVGGWNVEDFFTKKCSKPEELYNELETFLREKEKREGWSGFQEKCQLMIAEAVVKKLQEVSV